MVAEELISGTFATVHFVAEHGITPGHLAQVVLDNGRERGGINAVCSGDRVTESMLLASGRNVDVLPIFHARGALDRSFGRGVSVMRWNGSSHRNWQDDPGRNHVGGRDRAVVDEDERGIGGKGSSICNIPEGIDGLHTQAGQ